MELNKAFHNSRARCTSIGSALLEGPDWILPPTRLDDFGWFDPVLKIIEHPMGIDKKATACSVFVDNTVNRDQVFLEPLVRYAEWDREYESMVKRVRKWPKVEITHHILNKDEQTKLDRLLRKLDQTLSSITFLTAGLITDRSDPVGCYPGGKVDGKPRSIRIERWNFCQRIEFGLDEYAGLNNAIEEASRNLVEYIKQLCESDNRPNYRERYALNLKEMDAEGENWYYRPHPRNHLVQNRAG